MSLPRILLLPYCGLQLVASLHEPAMQPAKRVVVMITGGRQVRAGSHRGYLRLAHALAGQGCAVLRFDLPGQGDSEGEACAFERHPACIAAVIDALVAELPGVSSFALWGLCDGATAAALHAANDPRVSALCLVNPWLEDSRLQARATVRGYYGARLRSPEFWCKVLSGRVGVWRALRGYLSSRRLARSPVTTGGGAGLSGRLLQALRDFRGASHILLAGEDMTAQAFAQFAQEHGLRVATCAGADHTFSSPQATLWLERASIEAFTQRAG